MDPATIVRFGLSVLLGMGGGAMLNNQGAHPLKGEEPLVWEAENFPHLKEVDAWAELQKQSPPSPQAPRLDMPLFQTAQLRRTQDLFQQQPDLPRQIEPPKELCTLPEVIARLGWVDDSGIAYINEHTMQADWGKSGALLDGKHDLRKPIGERPGDTGKIGINPWVKPGKNTIRVVLHNKICCGASVYLDLWIAGEHKIKERFVKHYGKTGNGVYDQTFEFELPPCGMKG
jgi:hypothetical protein